MKTYTSITDQLSLVTNQIRLLAGLMLAAKNLQDIESKAFAKMLLDLSRNLECIKGELQQQDATEQFKHFADGTCGIQPHKK